MRQLFPRYTYEGYRSRDWLLDLKGLHHGYFIFTVIVRQEVRLWFCRARSKTTITKKWPTRWSKRELDILSVLQDSHLENKTGKWPFETNGKEIQLLHTFGRRISRWLKQIPYFKVRFSCSSWFGNPSLHILKIQIWRALEKLKSGIDSEILFDGFLAVYNFIAGGRLNY